MRKTEVIKKLARLRLEKLAPEEENVTHKLIYKRRKGGDKFNIPMAGGEARRSFKEGRLCYWLTVTCPTDKIKRGDLILDVKNQTTTHVQMDITDELINIMNNNVNLEKVIASRNDQHLRLKINDEEVARFISSKLSDRVQVDYEIQTWKEECPTCKGTGNVFPKYPKLSCSCESGKRTKTISHPIGVEGYIVLEEHQTAFSREELIEKMHQSLDATVTPHPLFRETFKKQLDKWIDKNL